MDRDYKFYKDRTPQMRYEISSAIFQERETAASIAFTQFEAVRLNFYLQPVKFFNIYM